MVGAFGRLLGLTAVCALIFSNPSPASADTLFDMLFGGGIKRTRAVEIERQPTVRKNSARQTRTGGGAKAARPRITGPTYFTYKADPLVRVDFAALGDPLFAVVPAAFGNDTKAEFAASLAGLSDYALYAEKDTAAALTSYYAGKRDFLWVGADGPNQRAASVLSVLEDAGRQGLDAGDYSVGLPASGSSEEAIRFEMALSARALRYIRDATGGRIDPNRISGYHDFAPKPLDLAAEMAALATAPDPAAFLLAKHPRSAEYAALVAELDALRARTDPAIAVDRDLMLKPGASSGELPKLLAVVARGLDDELGGEFGPMLAGRQGRESYDPELVPLVKALQKRAGLSADGVIGPRTVSAIVGEPQADRLTKVLYAMEQIRWLPSELGSRRVFVNQPAFTASYFENGIETLKMRAVVGTPATQTSFFQDEIEQVDFNPYWGVPQSILVNEMLPRLRRDPGYLDRAGYEVHDGKGRRVASSSVNWGRYGSRIPYDVRQSPSEANALGELKILFPNKHAIYMHDTPSKDLFKRDMRAFSHGCIRLQDPRGMAAAVLGISLDEVAEELGRGHSSRLLSEKIPVYIAYFTAWPTPAGTVEYFKDVYDRDSHLALALDATQKARSGGS